MASIAASSAIINIIDEHEFRDTIIGEHSYDSCIEEKCNVNDHLSIVNNIISSASPLAPDTSMQGDISRLIEFISRQMTCPKEYKNMEEKWNEIFQMVGSYRWTTQVLLVLAAFALQYGDFRYASEAPPEDRNAMSGYLWKALSPLKKKAISDGNKVAIKPLNDVVKDLCEWTTSLFDLIQLVYEPRGKHLPELASAFQSIPWWSCETIIAILAAANIFAQIISVNTTFTQSELEILKLSVSDKMKALRQKVDDLRRLIGSMEEYQKYVKYVEAPVDIADCLRLLLEDDSKQIPFARGPSNTPVGGDFPEAIKLSMDHPSPVDPRGLRSAIRQLLVHLQKLSSSQAHSDVGNALSTYPLKGLSSLKKKLISDENKAAAIIPVNEAVNELLELTTSLVGLHKLVIKHRGKHAPKLAEAFRTIPRWICETIIAILAAGNHFPWLIDGDKYDALFLVYFSDTA
ncbi:hypothetical protein ACJRO7_029855 [Eucalyptus globulus]|uniref:Sieve element occlusion N-terminal domain-containing protein n=1 Tax=Eucalyptus globulus TaxID=34317 RepID=A0ABD3JBR1_EUCGL